MPLPWIGDGGGDGQASKTPICGSSSSSSDETRVVDDGVEWHGCRELTTLWVARLDNSTELKVTDPKEQQGDVEEEETKGEERRDEVN